MNSSVPASEPQRRKGLTTATPQKQPFSSSRCVQEPPGLAFPTVPDHELLRCIGRGGYGAVWLAQNVMGTYRAVKIVHREDFTQDRPFTREYEGLLKFEPISRSHPNLMQVLHVGRHDSYFYYVTELADDANGVQGGMCQTQSGEARSSTSSLAEFGLRSPDFSAYVPKTLQEDLERRGRMPARECVSLAIALASALKHLHEHGLVHRDVKPSNVIFVHGVPKLADIGLVATAGDSRSIVGTEGYLPPEGPGNPQADLYSLGKLLYELSTGMSRRDYPRLPRDISEIADAQDLLEFNEVLLKACAKDTQRRYHEAAEMLADLALLQHGESVKRLRRLERHHALLKRVGAVMCAVGLVGLAAFWQSWRAHRIANRHLAQLQLNEGIRNMAEGAYAEALPWLVGALVLDSGDAARERLHRVRLANVLGRCPMPVAHFSVKGASVVAADLNPEGSLLATAHDDGGLRLWHTASTGLARVLPVNYPASLCQFLPSGDRLLTVTMRQQAQVWNLSRPGIAPQFFPQAQGAGSDLYSVGVNDSLGLNESRNPGDESPSRVYLSKGRYIFPVYQPYKGSFENLTLTLKLVGQGNSLLVKYEVCSIGADTALFQGEFLDTPKAETLARGIDDPREPIWGQVLLLLENASWADSEAEAGEVSWDNLLLRRYPTGAQPPPWQVLDDFSGGLSTNWHLFGLAKEGRASKVSNGHLVTTCARLPRWQTITGCLAYLEPFEISPTCTLEVRVDLISAKAPHRMASLSVARFLLDPFSAGDWPRIAHGRWLATTWWDTPLRLWDLEGAPSSPDLRGPGHPCVELGMKGGVCDLDFSPDTNYVAAVWNPEPLEGDAALLRVWDFWTGAEIPVDVTKATGVNGARFSPDGRFLLVSRSDGIELLHTSDWHSSLNLAKGASFESPRFSSRGHRVAAVREKRDLVVWNLGDQGAQPIGLRHQADIRCIRFSPDGRYLVASLADRSVRVWDAARAQAFGPPLPGALAQFTPDGEGLLVIEYQDGAWLWDLTRIMEAALPVPAPRETQLFDSSAHGALTAEITGQGVIIKGQAGQTVLRIPGQASVQRVAFSHDGQYLIAESSDGKAWIWDSHTRTLLGPSRSLRHDASLLNHFVPEVPVERRGQRTLCDLAALLSRQRPDGDAGMEPVDGVERGQILAELKRTRATEFADAPSRAHWHWEQALGAELLMDWDAAVFHWERAQAGTRAEKPKPKKSSNADGQPARLEGHPSEISAESRLAYARKASEVVEQALLSGDSRWSRILPRPPWATSGMLDLTNTVMLPLGAVLDAGGQDAPFRRLGSGVHVLGGTGFDVRSITSLKLTDHVSIPVGRPCARIHFLHAASWAGLGRETVGRYTVTYEDNRAESIELRTPDDVRPYSAHRFNEVSETTPANTSSNPRSDLAWCGYGVHTSTGNVLVYLTRTTWNLPAERRGETIKTIEVQRRSANSAPLILGITVE
jgi:WD40 repeat protein